MLYVLEITITGGQSFRPYEKTNLLHRCLCNTKMSEKPKYHLLYCVTSQYQCLHNLKYY